jgi:pyruvate,orthophosphate dikinase
MAQEGLITAEAVCASSPASLDQLLHPTLDPKAPRKVLAKGLPASPGAACGEVVFSADEAETRAAKGESVILVRIETSPRTSTACTPPKGILTTRGGMTSHAAVVARGMGRPCVSGAGGVIVDYNSRQLISAGGQLVNGGDIITLDGATGEVLKAPCRWWSRSSPAISPTLMGWADEVRACGPRQCRDAAGCRYRAKFGAEGIGLCRTEHMFFDPSRIVAVREMILSRRRKSGRRDALAKLLPMQRGFLELFRIMAGCR